MCDLVRELVFSNRGRFNVISNDDSTLQILQREVNRLLLYLEITLNSLTFAIVRLHQTKLLKEINVRHGT